jgi:hypothetical protein
MGVYLKPEYLYTIHYYFFSLGMVSLTNAFIMFTTSATYSYIFLGFYLFHSAITWYLSWFLHVKVRDQVIIKALRYTASHIILTLWSAGLAALMWYLFRTQYEAMVTSLLMINFFVIFLGGMWYILSRLQFAKRLFYLRETMGVRRAMDAVLDFRRRENLSIVDDDMLKKYKLGTNPDIDRLMRLARSQAGKDEAGFRETIRELEMALSETRIDELNRKMKKLAKEEMSEGDKKLFETYTHLVDSYKKKLVHYERLFRKRFRKESS